MLTVVCVLKTGGDYLPYHVDALANRVWNNLKMAHKFICLTDVPDKMPSGVKGIQLPDNWPGWWSKICLFKKGLLEGPVFYLDLDTIPLKNLDDIVLGHQFTVLRNFWPGNTGQIGSGLMAWDADLSNIYDSFKQSASKYINEYKVKGKWGDQGYIAAASPLSMEAWQDKHPGKVVSWKLDCQSGVPEEAAIVCFHGQPRPWQTPLWRNT